jgi:hexulose-6-phosphate isomerase
MRRREFLTASAAMLGALTQPRSPAGAAESRRPKLKKAVKFEMVKVKGTTRDRFELVKRLGFQGVEIDSPSGVNRRAAVEAQEATGVKIHGVIDNIHWQMPLSDPNPGVRAEGLAGLVTALEDAHAYGADDVLLVPGVARNGVSVDECWERSQAEIRKALPLAEKLGVKIAIEVVWNDFITTPDQFVRYIDSFQSPYLGGYFDCSNMVKYGVKPGDWIRKLGKRMVKFDFKGYSKSRGWVPIGEGDEDWPDVLAALGEIGYDGWATAEVSGGGEKELRDVAERMNRILQLS